MLSAGALLALLANGAALIPGFGSVWAIAARVGGAILRCKPCLYAIGTAALCAWTAIHIHRADVAGCTARIEDDHEKAEAARIDRDKGIGADLRKKYQPEIDRLSKENSVLQVKVKTNAKPQKPTAAGAKAPVTCKLGAAGLL
jgi:hypothetical protein